MTTTATAFVTRTKRPLYREIAALLQAIDNCEKSNNKEWLDKHTQHLTDLITHYLPSGSGFDSGTKLIKYKPGEISFFAPFHHMNENGMYDGWTDHTIIVTPSFDGIDLRITGRDRNDIKDYIHEMFHTALTTEIEIN